MTRQVFELTGLDSQSGWQGAVLIDPALIAGGGIAYLRYIERVGSSIRVRLGASETDDPLDAGPEFSAALETYDEAISFVGTDGTTLTLKGPGHPGNNFADAAEPYFWTPDNNLAMVSWFLGHTGDFTFILDDGVAEVVRDVGGTAAAGAAETAAYVRRVPPLAIAGRAEAGGVETAATVERVAQLSLADFDTAGLEVDALALIRAGAGGGDTLFALPPRGVVGAILDGEIGLGADAEIITRIRRRSGDVLAFNDDGPLLLSDYFGPGGDGADLTLYVQTVDGVGSLPVSTITSAGGNFIQFGPLGTALNTLVDDIADGQSFIIAFARAAPTVVPVSGTAAAGAAQAAATVARIVPAVRQIAGPAEAGGAEARARLMRIGHLPVRGTAASGAPALFAHVARVPPLAIRGRADAGGAQARARLTRIGHLPVRGTAASGAPAAFAHVARMPPPGEQYARTIRESAPERRLLTALEIRHPAVAQPVRVVNDIEDRTIEGNRYVALRFDARLADDVEGQAPQAELAIDNVGRDLTQWVEAAGGGAGATVRVLQVLDIDDPPVEWELTMDLAGVQVDAERVTARLGFDPLLGRAAVSLRHDPQTSPGLF